jgi:hypothetical protein
MEKVRYGIGRKTAAALAAMVFLYLGCSSNASASGIPLNVVGPHEYALPVNYASFNAVAQYAYVQNDGRAFVSTGARSDGPDSFTAVGFTKYVRFFTLKALPEVGFAWEFIQPEVSVQKTGLSVSGLGDPLTGYAVWIKPSKNSTVGVQSFLAIPIGTDQVSDKTWGSLTTLVGDVQLGDLDLDGQVGFIFRSTRHQTGAADVDPGNTFHTNVRAAYRVHKYLEPFLALDYQTTGASKDDATGTKIANSDSNELSVGGGLVVPFDDSLSLTMRYDYGVDGKNTSVTNAFHFKIAYLW